MNRLACGSRALAAAARRAAFRHARFLLPALALAAPPLAARDWFFDDPSHLLCAGIGTVELFDSDKALEWHAEFRPAWHYRHLRPWLFCGTGNHDCFYAALGILVDLRLGDRWLLTPSFGGGYYDSDGFDLGFHAEFRSGLELTHRFRNGHRLGVVFTHISNGSLGDTNPGTETLSLIYALPLDVLFGDKLRRSALSVQR